LARKLALFRTVVPAGLPTFLHRPPAELGLFRTFVHPRDPRGQRIKSRTYRSVNPGSRLSAGDGSLTRTRTGLLTMIPSEAVVSYLRSILLLCYHMKASVLCQVKSAHGKKGKSWPALGDRSWGSPPKSLEEPDLLRNCQPGAADLQVRGCPTWRQFGQLWGFSIRPRNRMLELSDAPGRVWGLLPAWEARIRKRNG